MTRERVYTMIDRKRVLTTAAVLTGFVVFAAGIAVVVGSLSSGGTSAQDEPTIRTVNVSGHGQVPVEPDTGLITVGVEVRDPDLDVALANSNETVENIIAAVTALGVAENDIQTSNFSIWPEYDWESEDRNLIGYTVNNTLNIKVREIDNTADVVAASVDAGANVVQGITFTVDDTSAAVSEARELAVQNAREKAEELASLANASLGQVVTISEYSFTPAPASRTVDQDFAESEAGAPPLVAGELIVTVNVEVSWELE